METLKQVLIFHARRYPMMEPTDAVKLIYQNEFGGGHLIRDEAACRAYLQREYGAVAQSDTIPLTEPIGNGLVRVNIAALDAHRYPPEALASEFIHSAAVHAGTLDIFLKKLDILRQVVAEGHFRFTSEALETYLIAYAESGYPMVSHSDAFRKAYSPTYRIILESCINVPKSK